MIYRKLKPPLLGMEGRLAKQEGVSVEGTVVEALPNAMFRVEL